MFKILPGLAPARLTHILTEDHVTNSNYHLRNSTKKVALPLPKKYLGKKNSLSYDGAKLWNKLPEETRNCETLASFKTKIIRHSPFALIRTLIENLFHKYFYFYR